MGEALDATRQIRSLAARSSWTPGRSTPGSTSSSSGARSPPSEERRWAEQEQHAHDTPRRGDEVPPQGHGTPPPAPSEADQAVAELEPLARLRDQGILTEEEFTAKAQQVLGI